MESAFWHATAAAGDAAASLQPPNQASAIPTSSPAAYSSDLHSVRSSMAPRDRLDEKAIFRASTANEYSFGRLSANTILQAVSQWYRL